MKKELENELLEVYNYENIFEYRNAIDLFNNKEYMNSREILKKLGNFRDSKMILKTINRISLLDAFNKYEKGDTLTFGDYYGPIEWYIIKKDEHKVFLLSKYALECIEYNVMQEDTTWEKCSLRKWLNNEFLHAAFTDNEIALIKNTYLEPSINPTYNTKFGNATVDKVFLLSINETENLSDDEMICKPTERALNQKCSVNPETGACWWWLRSPGSHAGYAAYVYGDGSVYSSGDNVGNYSNAVRPALYLSLINA